jgi:uncharacterized protein with HEPN domain
MNDRTDSRLEDALVAARHIHDWVHHSIQGDLATNVLLESAILLQLERIGEALRAVRSRDDAIVERFPTIHGWIALRHIISHAYREIDLDAIWKTCTEEIPELIETLERLRRG